MPRTLSDPVGTDVGVMIGSQDGQVSEPVQVVNDDEMHGAQAREESQDAGAGPGPQLPVAETQPRRERSRSRDDRRARFC